MAESNTTEARKIEFDVFISYSRRDQLEVDQLLHRLEGVRPKLRIWLDRKRIQEGDWRDQIEKAVRASGTCALVLGKHGLGKIQKQEQQLAFNARTSYEDFRLIPVFLPGATPDDVTFVGTQHRIEFDDISDQAPFDGLVACITGQASLGETGKLEDHPQPYRGLAAYGSKPEEAEFFFGRETEVETLRENLQHRPFQTVIGASGSGKTSLVQAGLIYQLSLQPETRGWESRVLRPGLKPLDALAKGLLAAEEADESETLVQELAGNPDAIQEAVENAFSSHLVLVVDRLEELFHPHVDQFQADALAKILICLAERQESTVWVVCTMRSDYFGDLSRYPELKDLVRRHHLALESLNDEQIERCVREPAKKVGALFERGLAERIIKDARLHREVDGNFMLPLLQQALHDLWTNRQGYWLTWARYEQVEGVEGALQTHADKVIAALNSDQELLAKRIFAQLIQIDEVTNRPLGIPVEKAQLLDLFSDQRDLTQVVRILDRLVENRLLVTGGKVEEKATVELIHDSLASRWEKLATWISEDRPFKLWQQQTEARRRAWHKTGESSQLLQGRLLSDAEGWLDDREAEIPDPLLDFISQSIDSRDKAIIADERRKRVAVAIGTAILLVVAVLAAIGWTNYWRAESQSKRALAERLTAQAVTYQRTLSQQAAAVFLGVAALGHSEPGVTSGEAFDVLRSRSEVLAEPFDQIPLENLSLEESSPYDLVRPVIEFDPKGQFVALGRGARLKVFLEGRSEDDLPFDLPGPIRAAAFSSGGDRLAIACGNRVLLWSKDQPKTTPIELAQMPEKVTKVLWAGPDLLFAGSRRRIRQLDTATGAVSHEVIVPGGKGWSISPDGGWLGIADRDGFHLRDRATSEKKPVDRRPCTWVVQFSPDGELVACGRDDHTVDLFGLPSGEMVHRIGLPARPYLLARELGMKRDPYQLGSIVDLSFHPKELLVAVAGLGGSALLWDLRGDSPVPIAQAIHETAITAVRFDSTGSRWATADDSVRPARRWRLPARVPSRYAVTRVSARPAGEQLAFLEADGVAVNSWDPENHALRSRVLPELESGRAIIDFSFSQDGLEMAAVSEEPSRQRYHLWFWRDEEGSPFDPVEISARPVRVVFNQANDRIVVGAGKSLWLWKRLAETLDERPIEDLGTDDLVTDLAVCPQENCLVVGAGRAARLMSASDGQIVRRFEHDATVEGVAINRTGELILSWDQQAGILWESKTGRELRRFPFTSLIDAVFHPMRDVIAASDGGRVYLWDARSGAELTRLRVEGVNSLDFQLPAGDRLILGTSLDGVQLLNWGPELLAEEACRRLEPYLQRPQELLPDAFRIALQDWLRITEGLTVSAVCP